MKLISSLFALAFAASYAHASEYAPVEIKWNSRYLDETVVLMCDDSYYSGVDLVIEGDYSFNGEILVQNHVVFKDCGTDWKLVKKEMVSKDGKTQTKVRFKGGSECTLEVHERAQRGTTPKVFTLTVGEAC